MKTAPFKRELNLWDAGAIVVGCIIGAGIFRVPSAIANHLDSPLAILATWIFGGLLSVAGALCYAELAGLFPKTGGDYVYLKETYGHATGFLFGWTKLFVERTGTIAIIAFVFAEYASYLFELPKEWARYLAVGGILLLTAANLFGLKYGKAIQNVFTSLKVLAIVLIIGIGAAFLPQKAASGELHSLAAGSPFALSTIAQAGMALIFVLWTYGGWTEAAYVAEEVKDPQRNVPLAILGGLSLVIALYLLINLIYYLYIPAHEMKETRLVAAVVVQKLVGPWGGKLVALFVAISTFGALNGYILTGGRILYALAQDHALFRDLSAVHKDFHTPYRALVFNAACSILLVLTKTFDQLMEYTTVVISVFFAMTAVAVIVLRKTKPDLPRPYRVWGYPWIPVLFAASTLLFIGNAVVTEPKESLFGLGLCAAGVALFWVSEAVKTGKFTQKT